MKRRDFIKCCGAAMLWPSLGIGAAASEWQKSLFVMDTWFWQAPPELDVPAQVRLLKKLDYPGMALSWGQKHAERLQALKEEGLAVIGCYITVDISGGYPKHLSECVELLRGTGGRVWLALTSKQHSRSDKAGDEPALRIIKQCADECRQAGLPGVALYPHVSFWMEKVVDALRLCEQAKDRRVGLQFNQYHWMAADGGKALERHLRAAKPYLHGVSINGSGLQPSILPLSEGEYDVTAILRTLYELKYEGPISHQGYSIKGNVPERLAAAKQAYDRLRQKAVAA